MLSLTRSTYLGILVSSSRRQPSPPGSGAPRGGFQGTPLGACGAPSQTTSLREKLCQSGDKPTLFISVTPESSTEQELGK